MKKIYKIIIVGLSVIILVMTFMGTKHNSIREGYNMISGTESAISKSDFYSILNECVENVTNHDTILNTISPTYKKNTINIDKSKTDAENIREILVVLKIQDIKIAELLPSYLPNTDLDGLLTGALLKPIAEDLNMKSTYPENPSDCDPATIRATIDGYQYLADQLTGNDDDSKNQKMTYVSMIPTLKMKLVDLAASKAAPGNTKCLPALSQTDAENILDGYYANHITKVVKSQDDAIVSIQNNIKRDVVKFYTTTI
jgi:hypothetical protein